MANSGLTSAQKHRLLELGSGPKELEATFGSAAERDLFFKESSERLAKENLGRLRDFIGNKKRLFVRETEEKIRDAAYALGFSEMVTPAIITRTAIEGMGITENNPLWRQIMWVDEKKCLRPMLAPGLYPLMEKLSKISKPVKIFEIGQCYRKDTKGAFHLEEFTMMNMVEYAPPPGDLRARIVAHIDAIMKAVGLNYTLHSVQSEVYGETLDVEVNGHEVASAALGPKPMDANWGINEPWLGVGFGLERIAMLARGYTSIARMSRSITYIDGNRLDVK